MWFLNTILDTLFPVYCLSCQKRGQFLCLKCISESPTAERESEKWIYPLYDYRHPPIKKALWLLKYNNKKKLADIFGLAMYGVILEELADLKLMDNFYDPLLIPIPLSKQRYRERGYNQAELICKKLMTLNMKSDLRHGVDYELETNILIKHRETAHQARIKNRTERLKNLSGSFSIKTPEKIKNRNIILIDDITTTGATLNEARKTLKKAGARKIIAFAVAH